MYKKNLKNRNKEACQASQQAFPNNAPKAVQSCPCPKREIKSITMKRLNVHLIPYL